MAGRVIYLSFGQSQCAPAPAALVTSLPVFLCDLLSSAIKRLIFFSKDKNKVLEIFRDVTVVLDLKSFTPEDWMELELVADSRSSV